MAYKGKIFVGEKLNNQCYERYYRAEILLSVREKEFLH